MCCEPQGRCARACELPEPALGPLRVAQGPPGGRPVPITPGLGPTLPARLVTALAFDAQDTLWIGTSCSGVYTYRDGAIQHHWDAYNTPPLPDSGIQSIAIDTRGTRWMVSRRGFIYSLDTGGWTVWGERGLVQAAPPGIRKLAHAPDGFWFVSHQGQLAHVRAGAIDTVHAPREELGPVQSLRFDHNLPARLWAATALSGPALWTGADLIAVSPEQFAGTITRDLWPHPGGLRLLVATASGLWMLENGWREVPTSTRIGVTPGPPEYGTDLATVLGRGEGLAAVHSESSEVSVGNQDLLVREAFGQRPTDVAFDLVGQPWVASRSGVRRREGDGWRQVIALVPEQPPPWQQANLTEALDLPSERVELDALLRAPHRFVGRKVHFRGRNLDAYRLSDESGAGRSVRMSVHGGWVRFQARGGSGLPHIGTRSTFEVSGFLEFGGCYGQEAIDDPWFQFFVVEYYPADMPVTEREAFRAQARTYCDANPCRHAVPAN